jgi:hypothetical protein
MYKTRPWTDRATGEGIKVYRAWIGDTQDGFEVFDTEYPNESVTGPWTADTAQEICDSMNKDT